MKSKHTCEVLLRQIMDRKLQTFGFECEKLDSQVSFWRRLWGEGIFIAITSEIKPVSTVEARFGATLYVQSKFVTAVIVEAQCAGPPLRGGFSEGETVAAVSLRWLALNGEPPRDKIDWLFREDFGEMDIDRWWSDFCTYAGPFLRQADTPRKLANLVRNLDRYPHRTKYGLEKHLSSAEFAAILSRYDGDNHLAAVDFAEELEIRRSLVARGVLKPAALAAAIDTQSKLNALFNDKDRFDELVDRCRKDYRTSLDQPSVSPFAL